MRWFRPSGGVFAASVPSLVILSCLLHLSSSQQRSPPGVNPQQYQGGGGQVQQGHHPPPPPPPQGHPQQQQFQQGHPQQFQQQQMHPQQMQMQPGQQMQMQPGQQMQMQPQPGQQQMHPQQMQQVQMQPQPGQQQMQMPQQPGGHAHGGHQQGGQRVLHKDMAHEREHMKEHMDVPIDTSNMSEQELQFHYFKMHDADGNNKLDGCELVKSLIHWHDESNHDKNSGQPIPEAKIFQDDELVNMIDPILATDDKNKDGFIDYPEFVQAQQAAMAKQGAQV